VGGLAEIVQRSANLTLKEMRQAILDGVAEWRNGAITDDLSLVIVEFLRA
jgi:serine phosphatase RsbU (regulator of sigma subunit)